MVIVMPPPRLRLINVGGVRHHFVMTVVVIHVKTNVFIRGSMQGLVTIYLTHRLVGLDTYSLEMKGCAVIDICLREIKIKKRAGH